jgi:hypothetical protein
MKAAASCHCRPLTEPDALEDVILPAPPPPEGQELRVLVQAVSVSPVVAELRAKSAGFHSEGMFARALFHTADLQRRDAIQNAATGLPEAGALRTTLTRHLGPITAASLREGHALMESGSMIGKAMAEGRPD